MSGLHTLRRLTRLRSTLTAALFAGFSAFAYAAGAQAAEPLKVAFVYIGPVNDAGWNAAHEKGRMELQAALGDQVKTSYVENVSEGADAERVIRQLAADGNKLIFATSFGYMQAALKVARMFPKTVFMHATGYKTAKNLGVYEASTYEGAYLMGVLAGGMTKSNTLGYVASFPIPEVIRNVDAFTLGAQSVNPKIKTKVIWVNTWYDPGKERQAAETLIAQGADALCQNTDSPATAQVAEQKGVYACGWDSDMKKFAPKAQLAASVVDWGPFYIKTAKDVMAGTWKSGDTQWGVAEGMVKVESLLPTIPATTRKAFDAKEQALHDGSFQVFQGPIKDQSGAVKVTAGSALDETQLRSLNWYVDGVDGALPK
ncbi:BMP family ABC transporter substrate-binding protein [Solimonas marina]|uniref:BMP family ABC transporter substrate-binding protein n=1 Tax=Solimonas marina TaxID=2714601 RepID=A0A970B7T8_9GAMM|nr:BMP family ABC transporter substrate-binding protein [Solimonas marina]NKF24248.1 BMP family ABC transporter substrate-binding protein [Solimonas marina]